MEPWQQSLVGVFVGLAAVLGALVAAAGCAALAGRGPLVNLPRGVPLALALVGLGAIFGAIALATATWLPFLISVGCALAAGAVAAWHLARL